jgi:hypothetical protein
MPLEHLDQLREMKRNRPFVPFRIVTTGSEAYVVEDRFQFAVGHTEFAYARPAPGGIVRVSADQIAAVEVTEQKSPA